MWFRPASSIIPIRAFQYACADYVDRLEEHGFEISMSRKGAPWENAKAESFIKTLKAEEVWLNYYKYRDLEHARRCIGDFLEEVYNRRRLHSSPGYLPPATFEANFIAQHQTQQDLQPLSRHDTSLMSFLRHRESYPSDGGVSIEADASANRSDEFPAGYSLAGCSPAEPASASPTGTSMPRLSAEGQLCSEW